MSALPLRICLLIVVGLALLAPIAAGEVAAAPHFILLPGIEGTSICTRSMVAGVYKACPDASVEVFDWTTGKWFRLLEHLCAWERNRVVSGLLADHIRCRRAAHPGQPLILVGHSGGGAMIVMALERLPADCQVHQAILIAPGLAPDYDLTAALARAEHGLDVYHSPLDCLVIGVGTVCLGTIDRQRKVSAGMVGFRLPRCLDEPGQWLYQSRLRQHRYRPGAHGCLGGHFSCTSSRFVAALVKATLVR